MSEEIKKRGRQPGQTKDKGFIHITDKLRIRIETDSLVTEEKIGLKEDEDNWGNFKYHTSWNNMLKWLVRRLSTEKIASRNDILTMQEARADILAAIKELRVTLLGEIAESYETTSSDVRELIKKFNI